MFIKITYTYCENESYPGSSPAGGPVVPSPLISTCLAARLLHTFNIVFKRCDPLVIFGPPRCEMLATGLILPLHWILVVSLS